MYTITINQQLKKSNKTKKIGNKRYKNEILKKCSLYPKKTRN